MIIVDVKTLLIVYLKILKNDRTFLLGDFLNEIVLFAKDRVVIKMISNST
jgi:hypothetical protein